MANLTPFDSERFLGNVFRVGPSEVRVDLTGCQQDPTGKKSFQAHLGSYVVLGSGEYALFGQIHDISLSDPNSATEDGNSKATGLIELFSSIHLETGKVTPGIAYSPGIGDSVYAPTSEFVQYVVTGQDDGTTAIRLDLAQLPDASQTVLAVTPEKLFGRHCAILGATGGGKSWTLARIVEEAARFNCKIILVDATGEYAGLDCHTQHLHFGQDAEEGEDSTQVSLPFYHLTEQDLFAIFRPHGPSQSPKLRAAMKSLKLAKVSSSVGIDGLIIKAHKPKTQYERSYQHHLEEIDNPYATFDIRSLTRQIENECIDPQRSSTEPDVWGGINATDLANCMPMIGRINDILQSPNLAPIFKPGKKPSLLEEIHRFIRSKEKRVLRINMQFLSFAHGAREIIANAIARHMFELAQKGCFVKRPLLVVLDEAHQFLNPELSRQDSDFPLDAFGLIAKEGRKYSMNICLATQRPRDIPEDVLSQMGTMIVHRLINDQDRAIIERACGEVDQSSIRLIPSLGPGEAVMAGVAFPVPVHIRVIAPDCRPRSEGANYQRFWQT